MACLVLLLFLFPLIGVGLNGWAAFKGKSRAHAGRIAVVMSGLAFVVAVILSASAFGGQIPSWGATWIQLGGWDLRWEFRFDALTAVMALMVTGVGTLIHVYSVGYMTRDEGQTRYFAFLNLFLAAMLLLVTADNLLVLFVGWEGVGLCSYLLIGFWFKDLKNTRAGTKAFIANRIGDAAFLLGIFLVLREFGTVRFEEMNRLISTTSQLDRASLEWIALLLFMGAVGKSAQIPLFVWLPDAMAGPTPVSALIHAATMVTAGVYLVCRLGFLYEVAGAVSQFVASIGVVTALFAASIACVQRDIKKILAYSTVSQLGLMFVAAGVGNYVASIFHVVTHAFFKACLFLGAGSVIHALDGEQDVTKMGGLRKPLPWTSLTFLIAVLAIAGMPPLAGFFSKDAILYSAMSSAKGGMLYWLAGLLTSTLTSFYMARLYFLTFTGEPRSNTHPHESPASMVIPLVVTALGAASAGLLSVPHDWHWMPDILGGLIQNLVPAFVPSSGGMSETMAMVVATSLGAAGIVIGYALYGRQSFSLSRRPNGPVYHILWNKFWVDELYEVLFLKPFEALSRAMAYVIDPRWIDALVLLPAAFVRSSGILLGYVQSGRIQSYLMVMLTGILLLWVFLTRVTP